MELKRQLGVKYDTAWMLKHKLLQAMKESDDKQSISGIIQLGDVYRGGERRGRKMRMKVVDGFQTKSIADWAKRHVASGSTVISDGPVSERSRRPIVRASGCCLRGNLDWLDHPAFNWVNTMIGNMKNSLRGSCHTLGAKHLLRYLAECCFRFNHRLTSRACWLNWGTQSWQAPRCHIGSCSWLRVMGN